MDKIMVSFEFLAFLLRQMKYEKFSTFVSILFITRFFYIHENFNLFCIVRCSKHKLVLGIKGSS